MLWQKLSWILAFRNSEHSKHLMFPAIWCICMYSQEGSVFIGKWVKNWKNKFCYKYRMAQNILVTKISPSFSFLEDWMRKGPIFEMVGSFLKMIKIKEENLNSVNVTLWLKASALGVPGWLSWTSDSISAQVLNAGSWVWVLYWAPCWVWILL